MNNKRAISVQILQSLMNIYKYIYTYIYIYTYTKCIYVFSNYWRIWAMIACSKLTQNIVDKTFRIDKTVVNTSSRNLEVRETFSCQQI